MDNPRTQTPRTTRRLGMAVLVTTALLSQSGPHAAAAWEALPYQLHTGLAAGDLHMGVRLLGALQLPRTQVDGIEMVELSALGYDDDNDILYLLSDQGAVFHARIRVDEDGLAGIEMLAAHVLRDKAGAALTGRVADSEGLTVLDGNNGIVDDTRLLVSFERDARVAEYRPDGRLLQDLGLPPRLDRKRFASINRGPEALTSDATGRYYLAPERPLRGDQADRVTIFRADGRQWTYRLANNNSAVVALEMLDGDEMLVLERDFDRFLFRLVTRLRIATGFASDDRDLAVRDLATFDNREGWRVDNFEGLTRWRGNRYLVVSDDNESVLQRTLLFMFEFADGRDALSPKYEPVQDADR